MPRLPLILLAACTEYNVSKNQEPSPGGEPDIAATPLDITLGLLCAEEARDVTVSNEGDADLTLSSITLDGDGWSMGAVSLPVTLAPGEELVIPLTSVGGSATLILSSDDPDTPELSIPLSATGNTAPTVEITTPTDASVLDPGVITAFSASVADGEDSPDSLSLRWTSDIDGELSTAPSDAAGLASLSWDGSVLDPGAHTVTLTATDSCGAVGSDTITVCQNAGYIEESVDLESWHFEGSALWDAANGWVQLTAPLETQAGTAFQTSTTVEADNVVIAFSFYASGGSGADGLSVTALDTTRMTTFVGTSGGGIGYGGLPGWSVEVDTWYNSDLYDPTTEDHLSVLLDGNAYGPVVSATLPEMEDGAWHSMSVAVTDGWMTVAVDGVTYIDQTVPGLTAFPAYVGFTAATGAATNYHLIDALAVQKYVCEG